MYGIDLNGCRVEPLMSYLKALGVLRVISRQKDGSVRGAWRQNHFVLYTNMNQDDIIDFFMYDYRPTPVFSPWNKGSGFYPRGRETEAVRIIGRFRDCSENRLGHFSRIIRLIDEGIEKVMGSRPEEVDNKTIEERKNDLMAYCRNMLPDDLVEWMDVVFMLTGTESTAYQPYYAIVMGSGGNDGNLEFSINYLKSICDSICMIDEDQESVRAILADSLFETGDVPAARKGAIGFFHPGGVGGPNSTEGFEGEFLSNPWDFIFMVEGVFLLAGSVNRRLGIEPTGRVASFPFSVTAVSGGANVISAAEGTAGASRGELWLPLWGKPMGLSELKYLFSEGRARLGRRTAVNGLDFARSVATLGISRGLTGFVRYGIYQRSGRSYLAVPLCILPVRDEKLKGADLLSDIDLWLSFIKNLSTDENIPVRAREVPRRVNDAIFAYLMRGDSSSLERLVVMLGKANLVLSALPPEKRTSIPPLNLSRAWAEHIQDHTPEFRIAYAMAAMGWTGADLHPVRMDLDPVEIIPKQEGGHRAVWAKKVVKTVPYINDPIDFQVSIFEHRCMLGIREEKELPPIGSTSSVTLEDVSEFLSGRVDYRKIIDLFLGLLLINDPKPIRIHKYSAQDTWEKAYSLPRDYILLKACFLPEPILIGNERLAIPYDLKILYLLKGHKLNESCIHAARKLKIKEIVPLSTFGKAGIDPVRFCASLLIPIEVGEFASRALPLIKKREIVRMRY